MKKMMILLLTIAAISLTTEAKPKQKRAVEARRITDNAGFGAEPYEKDYHQQFDTVYYVQILPSDKMEIINTGRNITQFSWNGTTYYAAGAYEEQTLNQCMERKAQGCDTVGWMRIHWTDCEECFEQGRICPYDMQFPESEKMLRIDSTRQRRQTLFARVLADTIYGSEYDDYEYRYGSEPGFSQLLRDSFDYVSYEEQLIEVLPTDFCMFYMLIRQSPSRRDWGQDFGSMNTDTVYVANVEIDKKWYTVDISKETYLTGYLTDIWLQSIKEQTHDCFSIGMMAGDGFGRNRIVAPEDYNNVSVPWEPIAPEWITGNPPADGIKQYLKWIK